MNPALEKSGFKIINKLGQGGTAEVFHVLTQGTNREAALKIPFLENSDTVIDFRQLVQREEKILSSIKYPGIVNLLEVSTGDPSYILMELCHSLTLEQIDKIDNIKAALNIFSAIAINLEFLKAKSIIHADLKPDNIFLPSDNSSLCTDQLFYVKLSDFSLGRFINEDDTVRAGVGTVGYMAPETILDETVSYNTDIFSCGIIFYQLLSGQNPFLVGDPDPQKINSRICEKIPNSLLELRDDVPPELAQLIEQMLNKDPKNRPQGGWEICQSLRKCGATYPFEKAILPKHLLESKNDFESSIRGCLRIDNNQLGHLVKITNADNINLRIVLADNYNRRNLYYENLRFNFNDRIFTPKRIYNQALSEFNTLSYDNKKDIILTSIIGDSSVAEQLNIQQIRIAPIIYDLIIHFISTNTVKRFALKYGNQLNSHENQEYAAKLYMMAGELKYAEESAYQAVFSYKKENQNEKALKLLRQIIGFGKLTCNEFQVKQLIKLQADILKLIDDTAASETAYRNIIDIYKNHPPDKLLAETYKDLGDLYKIKQQYQDGINATEEALKIYQQFDDQLEISHIYNNLGNIYWIANDIEKGISHYRKALKIQRKNEAIENMASTINNLGAIYAMKGLLKRGIKLLNISLSLKKEIGDLGEIARTLNNIGFAYFILGDSDKAIENLKESLEYNRRIGSNKEILFNLENLTAIMISSGRIKKSIEYLKEGITLAEQLLDKPHMGMFNVSLSQVFFRMGRIEEGYHCLNLVERVLTEIDDKVLEAMFYIEKARVNFYLGDLIEAVNHAQQSCKLAESSNDKNVLMNSLLLYSRLSSSDELFERSFKLADELNLKREKLLLMVYRLSYALRENQLSIALENYNNLGKMRKNISSDVELADMHNTTAEYLIKNNNYEEAITYLDQATLLATESSLKFDLMKTIMLQGEVYLNQNDYEKSFTQFKKAMIVARDISQKISSEQQRHTFQKQETVVYLARQVKELKMKITKKGQGVNPVLSK